MIDKKNTKNDLARKLIRDDLCTTKPNKQTHNFTIKNPPLPDT